MVHTSTMESLVETTRISEQDTIPGQESSSSSLMASIKSKPFSVLLGIASFSVDWLLFPLLSSKRTEASQPFKQNENHPCKEHYSNSSWKLPDQVYVVTPHYAHNEEEKLNTKIQITEPN